MPLGEVALNAVVNGLVGLAVKAAGEAAPDRVRELSQAFQNPSKQYVQTYLKRHGNVQILGMSREIPLDEIYTQVFMLDTESIRRYETVEGLEQIYRKANQRGFNQNNSKTKSGMEVANAEQYLCVLGGPGIGKTTYLRKIGLEALLSREGQYQHKLIPVFLELKNFTNPDLNLKDEITHEFNICGFPDAPDFTDKTLKAGNLLILLDGLDEVPSDNLNRVVRAIKNLSDQYSKNRFMVSCRIAAYHTYFKGFYNVAVTAFSEKQINQFISNWFLADPNPDLTREEKLKNGRDCWQQLENPMNIPAKELSQTPLLLTFICLVFRKSKSITDNRVELYAEALDILLKGWYKEKALEKSWEIYQYLTPRLETELLAEIAYIGFEEDKLFFKKEDLAQQISTFLADTPKAPKVLDSDAVIDAISVQQGILVERAKDIYSFSHLTFQEYLCAEYVIKWNYQERLVKNHTSDDHWREIFFLVIELRGWTEIELLEKLEVQIQELANHPKLKGLLAWADEKTAHSTCEYFGETKRIFALTLILGTTCILSSKRNRNPHFAMASASDLRDAGDLANALMFTYDIATAFAAKDTTTLKNCGTLDNTHSLANAFAKLLMQFAMTIEETSYDPTRSDCTNFDLTLNRIKFNQDEELFVSIDLQIFISQLKNATSQNQNFGEEQIAQISSSLDITPELLDLTQDNSIAFFKYLSTCKFMIDFSKQASGISAQQWDSIKKRMFLPKPTE